MEYLGDEVSGVLIVDETGFSSDRPQSVHNGYRSSVDCPEPSLTVRRVTVSEAAEILIKTEVVRSRM